ncbi:hypothetical protein HZS_4693, partial [Henneguya salminicola]
MGKQRSSTVVKSVARPPRAIKEEDTDDSSSISSSSSSETSPVTPPTKVESASAALALFSIEEEKTVPEISPVIPRRALNIRVETRIPVQTAADSSAPKKKRRGRRGGKRHKAAEKNDKGKNSRVKTGHTGPARPKGSQQPNTVSKTKAAAKRLRTARPRPAKARGPTQQFFIQALASCAHRAHPGYPLLPGYCCCHRPVAPCQAPLVCHNQSAAQNPWDRLTRLLGTPSIPAFILKTLGYDKTEAELAADIASFALHKLSPRWVKNVDISKFSHSVKTRISLGLPGYRQINALKLVVMRPDLPKNYPEAYNWAKSVFCKDYYWDVVAGTRSDFVSSHFPTLSNPRMILYIYARHSLPNNRVDGRHSEVSTVVKRSAWPKGSQRPDQGSKAKAAVERRRTASSNT